MSLFKRLNALFGAAQLNPDEESAGAPETSDPQIAHSDEELLRFFDFLKPHPQWWDHHLREQGVNVPSGDWVRLTIDFALLAGDSAANGTPHLVEAVSVSEGPVTDEVISVESSSPTRSTEADRRLCWVTRAEVEDILIDGDADASPTTWISMNFEGYGVAATARFREGVDGKRGEFWIPLPDLLEAQDGWDRPRHHLVPIFAGDRDESYFKSLATPSKEYSEHYVVKRKLPFVIALLLWADSENGWARDAVRRHNEKCVYLRRTWYDDFAARMTGWLKLWSLNELPFTLQTNTFVSHDRKIRVSVLAKCVFVREKPPSVVVEGTGPVSPDGFTLDRPSTINGSV